MKIRDKEIAEPPHVTVLKGSDAWRYDLRARRFMDRHPPPRLVPRSLVREIEERGDEIAEAWDEMYPDNPVEPEED